MIFFWQVDIMIWEVDINNLQVNMKIWQVDIIIWQVMAEICDHRCQTDINMNFCLLTLKIINAKHIISYIVTVWHIQVIRRHLVSFGVFPLRRCLFLFIFTYLFILWFYLSFFFLEICRHIFLCALLYCHMNSKHGNFFNHFSYILSLMFKFLC